MGDLRRRAAAALAAVTVLVVPAGCADGRAEPGAGGTGTSPAPATGTTSPSEPPAGTPGSPASSVAPATGIELTEATSSLRAPEGWVEGDGVLDYASAARGPGPRDSLLLADHESLAGPDATYESLAQSWLEVAPKGAKTERLPDVDLDGTPAYLIFYTVPGDPSLSYDVGTIRNGQSIDISFVLDKKTLAQDPRLVESVLASFRWRD